MSFGNQFSYEKNKNSSSGGIKIYVSKTNTEEKLLYA